MRPSLSRKAHPDMTGLFTTTSPRVFSIPAGENYLDAMASVLAAQTGLAENPEALADALIYVPNSRSKMALGFALVRASGREACLLPDIRALGDLESDEAAPGVEAALAELPPAIPNAERIGELTRLVMKYYEARGLPIPAPSALSAARELARLLDQAALSGDVDWGRLESIVEDRELAIHWRDSLKFLEIITQQWPVKLEDAAKLDPYTRRYKAAEAMAQVWRETPPQTPVIIAGSTGATPASRILMQAARDLPKGLIILPGLDRDVPDDVWETLSQTPSHPQFTLARALRSLTLAPQDVAEWPIMDAQASPLQASAAARRRLIHEALAPADNTADWTERLVQMAPNGDSAAFVTAALQGLTLIETKDDTDEAWAAALLMRQTLETSGETAALVTPDAGLARHVSALLKQWNVHVPPSSGLPLLQSTVGSFAYLISDWMNDLSHPVKLLAVLRSGLTRFEAGAVDTLDKYFLRGPRIWQDWHTLRAHVDGARDEERRKYSSYTDTDIDSALTLLDRIHAAIDAAGIDADAPPDLITGPDWFTATAALMTEIAPAPAPWLGEGGASVSKCFTGLYDLSAPLGPQTPEVFIDLLKSELTTSTLQIGDPHPRLAIWGPLEARLQTADRIILAGLNEGIWPGQPPADAFLPRVFRKEIGLSDPDERIGLSAHDFAQLAAAPNVTLLTSQRRDDKPVVASRWIWRLRTLSRGALGPDAAAAALAPDRANDPRVWIKALQTAPPLPTDFKAEPRPTPKRQDRPDALSVTRIETLVRDPYAIYCQYVLGLQKLDALNLPTDVRNRGTAIHRALERLENAGQDKTVDGLMALLEAELSAGGETEAELIALREKRREVAAEYLDWRSAHADRIDGALILEKKGKITLKIAGEDFTLSGTADRIERRIGGKLAILDFKSGKPPSEAQVRAGLSPQMTLQGLIAQRGGYAKYTNATEVEALTYVRFGTQFDMRELGESVKGRNKLDAMDIADLITDAEVGLTSLLTKFANPDHPYLSAPRPERVSYWSDYTRLARRDEWAGLSTYD